MRERPAETELGTSPLPSPRGGKFSLDLSSLSPFHRLPFSLESHTQQGNDEYHSEENQVSLSLISVFPLHLIY